MQIKLDSIGKRYANKEWIIKDLSYQFEPGDRVAIVGNNGSGKSTLLKMIGGMILPSNGSIDYVSNGQSASFENVFRKFGFAAPYLELIEEFSLIEFVDFHFKFKELKRVDSIQSLIDILYLNGHENKQIKNFSSGMKQRLQLGITFFSNNEIVLLDEPTSNLDKTGISWYQNQITQFDDYQIVIIASNQAHEYEFCSKKIDLSKT